MLRRFILLWFLLSSTTLFAHVKWFAKFDMNDLPLTPIQSLTGYTLPFFLLSLVVVLLFTFLDTLEKSSPLYKKVETWLNTKKDFSNILLRCAVAMSLILNWDHGVILAPELTTDSSLLGWFQFFLALLCLFKSATGIVGAGLLVLYGLCMSQYGFFHMLDYTHYIGVAAFFILAGFRDKNIRELRFPILYASVGFALSWLACEKLLYPEWALQILELHSVLTLGFDPYFFLTGAAFVELSLGFLILFGLLERPIALLITLVFFSTTLVFGKIEVVGHTTLHAILIIFLIQGTGTLYPAPHKLFKNPAGRYLFVGISFIVFGIAMAFLYEKIALLRLT